MRNSVLKRVWSKILCSAAVCAGIALCAGMARAQQVTYPSGNPSALLEIYGVLLVLCLAFYVYVCACLQVIARKTGTAHGWLAWIPIANSILMLNIARRPIWWFILLLIPLVNLVVTVVLWIDIAKARQKAAWWGAMVIVPIMNLIAPGYIASA